MATEIRLSERDKSKLLEVVKQAQKETQKAVAQRMTYDEVHIRPYGFFGNYRF